MEKTINKIYNLVLKYKGCTLNDEECKLFQELQKDLEVLDIIKIKEKKGIIPLAKGYGLIVPEKSDSITIMEAIGMLIQILCLADKEQGVDYEKFKKMINSYVDKIYTEVQKGVNERNVKAN